MPTWQSVISISWHIVFHNCFLMFRMYCESENGWRRIWRLQLVRKRDQKARESKISPRLTSCTCFVLSRSFVPPKINLQNRIKRRKRRVMESIRANFAVRFCPRLRTPYKRNTHRRKTLTARSWDLWIWNEWHKSLRLAVTKISLFVQ